MRVLVLHQHYWPEIAATCQLLADVCEDLVERGHEVTVICGQPSYRKVQGQHERLPAEQCHRGVHIKRVWSYIPTQRSIPRRLLNYGSYFLSSLFCAFRQPRPDVVFIISVPPLLLGLSGLLLKWFRGLPFLYSVQDVYPDIAVHLGMLKEGPVLRIIDRISGYLYRAASQTITLCEAMAARLISKGVSAETVHVVPNWADTNAIVPLPRDNAFAREHGLVEGFVVQYSGNVGLSQGLENVIDAAALLKDLPVRFAIVGDGNARVSLQKRAEKLKLDNVLFVPPQPRDKLPELLASCDAGLVTMKKGVGGDLVPSKLYGILAAGRPVIASVEPESEVAKTVRKFQCGVLVSPEDAEALASAIGALVRDSSYVGAQGQAARLAAEQYFSRTLCTRRYADVLESVVAPRA